MAIIAIGVFALTLGHGFVVDDPFLIVRNPLIQDPSLFWRAVTSDAFAYQGTGSGASSSFWRPGLMAWFALCTQLLGVTSATPWHVINVIGHAAVSVLVFSLARRLSAGRWLAMAIAILFAVHPIHVEVTAYVSVVGDILLSLAFLGSIWWCLNAVRNESRTSWIISWALAAAALTFKESAVSLPIVIALIPGFAGKRTTNSGDGLQTAALRWLPYVLICAVYLLLRRMVTGSTLSHAGGAASILGLAPSLPLIIGFYLRQMFLPLWLSPAYGFMPLQPDGLTWMNFGLPLLAALVALGLLILAWRAGSAARLGVTWTLATFAPVAVIGAFFPESLVHDRYVYLTSIGLLMGLAYGIRAGLKGIAGMSGRTAEQFILCGALIAAVPLSLQTVRYSRAWHDSLSLWTWGAAAAPDSAVCHRYLGSEQRQANQPQLALASFDRAVAISPTPANRYMRATALVDVRRYDEAAAELLALLPLHTNPDAIEVLQIYEALGVCYQRAGNLHDAAAILRRGRDQLPARRAALTEMLAVILYQQDRKDEALAELESARTAARTELTASAKLVPYRIGMLHVERRDARAAVEALQEFMDLSRGLGDPEIVAARAQASHFLTQVASRVGTP